MSLSCIMPSSVFVFFSWGMTQHLSIHTVRRNSAKVSAAAAVSHCWPESVLVNSKELLTVSTCTLCLCCLCTVCVTSGKQQGRLVCFNIYMGFVLHPCLWHPMLCGWGPHASDLARPRSNISSLCVQCISNVCPEGCVSST